MSKKIFKNLISVLIIFTSIFWQSHFAYAIDLPNNEKVPGLESCTRAAQLATKFGAYTILGSFDKIPTEFLNTLSKSVSDQLSSFATDAGSYIGNFFGDIIGQDARDKFNAVTGAVKDKMNKYGEEVQKKSDEIKDNTKGKLKDIADKYKEEDEKKNLQNKSDMAMAEQTSVPITEKGAQFYETKKVNDWTLQNAIQQKQEAEVIQDTREKCGELLKITTETIKRSLLYQLSGQISDWITSGETPQFIKDPGGFLEKTAQLAVDRTISRIAPRLCTPFQLSIVAQIPTTNRQANPFYEELTCTLDQITGNIESFYNDFRSGGWIAYQEMWKPQNNYYGASMLVEEKLAQQEMGSLQLAQDDLQRGSGFPSQTRCVEWHLYEPVDCNLNSLQEQMSDILQVRGACYAWGNVVEKETEDGKKPPVPTDKPSGSYWECARSEITNPGTVTASLSQKAQQVEIDQLAASNDIENFLDTIGDAIINKLVKSGVNGLRGLLKGIPSL